MMPNLLVLVRKIAHVVARSVVTRQSRTVCFIGLFRVGGSYAFDGGNISALARTGASSQTRKDAEKNNCSVTKMLKLCVLGVLARVYFSF